MAQTSQYFNWIDALAQEDDLFQDLVDEQIHIYGLDLKYLPRTLLNYDQLLGESSKSAFNTAINIPMYVKSYDGYDQAAQMLTKFGVRSAEELTLVISQRVWRNEIQANVTDDYANAGVTEFDSKTGQTVVRAKEGDLVYNVLDDSVYEIKQVIFDIPFFQLGSNYTFELVCEKFEYSGETFDTGIDEIDDTPNDITTSYYFTQFAMDAGGTGAFTVGEELTVYNVAGIENPTLTPPDPIVPFVVDKDSGVPHQVPTMTGHVVSWDPATNLLVVRDLSDFNPEKLDSNNNLDASQLDTVLVVGADSSAAWLSSNSDQRDVPFTDNGEFQSELDVIKIVDSDDTNAFGFF